MTAFSILSTTSHAVSGVATSFTPSIGADPNALNAARPLTVRLWSDVGINIKVGGGAATFDDLALAPGLDGILIAVPVGAPVSLIKQSGEVDGTAWASVVKRT